MFIFEKPIETTKDDFLRRKRFSQHLGKALLDWNRQQKNSEGPDLEKTVVDLLIQNISENLYPCLCFL